MKLGTPVAPQDESFRSNYQGSLALLATLGEFTAKLSPDPESAAVTKHRSRGKLLARERINEILDPGAPFLEIGALAGITSDDGVPPGACIVTGIGTVASIPCVIIANDATAKGGTYFPLTVRKHLRAQEISATCFLPTIYLVDSGGAFLPHQDRVFPDRDHFGRIFFNQARMSARGIPQIAAVCGSCTAGGAYVPAMSDETIIVREQGTIFLGGPPLVKAATGESVTPEELGGALVHSSTSGVTDYLAHDDYDAIRLVRRIVRHSGHATNRVRRPCPRGALPPAFDIDEILGLIPTDQKHPLPMREILARIVDNSELDEFKARYGETLITGFAAIGGYDVGIVANDGILFSESALKGAHFVQLCDRRSLPIIFLQNITGFMVGKEYEHQGIAKAGAKMVTAVACAQVPKITVVVGNSFGAGNYAMAGRAYDPLFLFMWPNARIGVMGPEQAAQVLGQVRRESRGSEIGDTELESYQSEIRQKYEREASAWYSTGRLWDDGVIDPRLTRDILIHSLSLTQLAESQENKFGIFRM